MGWYVVPSFQPGSTVVQFHSYSPMKKGEVWDANPNTETGKKYLTNIAAISALAVVLAVLAMLEYWYVGRHWYMGSVLVGNLHFIISTSFQLPWL